MLLKDKVAIITGAASVRGIGWTTAKRFADEGARVAILDLNAGAIAEAAAALESGELIKSGKKSPRFGRRI